MLNGDVFAEQTFKNEIFALFIDTFLNGANGIASNYGNDMALSYSGGSITIDTGAVCVQGRFMHESSGTTKSVGETSKYHRLVIEIDLSKTNTEEDFLQGDYKILTGNSSYPSLTQQNIIKNPTGIYQYELAQFRTNSSGNITDFVDKRTFLDFDSIYAEIEQHIQDIDEGSLFVLKTDYNTDKTAMNTAINGKQKAIGVGTSAPARWQ